MEVEVNMISKNWQSEIARFIAYHTNGKAIHHTTISLTSREDRIKSMILSMMLNKLELT